MTGKKDQNGQLPILVKFVDFYLFFLLDFICYRKCSENKAGMTSEKDYSILKVDDEFLLASFNGPHQQPHSLN